METVVSEIAKIRMEKDVNEALLNYGLYVRAIGFYECDTFGIRLELRYQNEIDSHAS